MFCGNCGLNVGDEAVFCPHCGKSTKGDEIVLHQQGQQNTYPMNNIILNIIRLLCIVVVVCFFSSYFVISCMGQEAHISGKDAAFGFDMGNNTKSDASPVFLLIPGVALFVLIAMGNPSNMNGQRSHENNSVTTIIPVIGSIIGLALLFFIYNSSIGEVKKQIGGQDISSVFRTGNGFRLSVAAFIIMFVMPFLDKILNSSSTNSYNRNSYSSNKKCRQCDTIYSGSQPFCPKCNFSLYEETNQSIDGYISPITPLNVNYRDTWICKKCDERNPLTSCSCKGCGAYK